MKQAFCVMYLIGAVFLCCVLLADASYYRRTISYKRDVVLRCYDKDNPMVGIVMGSSSVDIWNIGTDSVDMKMSRKTANIVRRHLPRTCHVLVSNVERHVKMAERHMLSKKQKWLIKNGWDVVGQSIDDPQAQDWHNEYHDYPSIISWYKSLAAKYPHLMKVTTIGHTAEKREMIGVHITASTNPNRNRMYIQCLIHAREWISGAVCMYQVQKLVESYDKNSHNELLKVMEFVFVPVVNPDGYAFTWAQDRLWRKNRVVNKKNEHCRGVDLNRNFDEGWEKDTNPCSITYHGPQAGSELEVQHVKKFFKDNAPIVASIDFHSYGQLILRPYGHTYNKAQDDKRFIDLGDEIAQEMSTTYVSKRSIDLYRATGIASDWFYGKEVRKANKNIRPASFTIELRDKGNHGFLLPASQIMPTVKEARRALLHLARSTNKTPLT